MQTSDYIKEIKKARNLITNKEVALLLGVKPNSVTRYSENVQQFSPETAEKVSKLIHTDPKKIASDMFAQRSNNAKTRKFWASLPLAFLIASTTTNDVNSVQVPSHEPITTTYSVYIMLNGMVLSGSRPS